MQGKSLKNLEDAWSELGLSGADFFGLQELGGHKDLVSPWQVLPAHLDGAWGFYACNPPLAFRTVAGGVPARLFPYVEKVFPMSCGIGVVLKRNGIKTFVVSAHLPHRQRKDCIDTWQIFNSELEVFLKFRRFQDSVLVLHDTNYELGAVEHCMNPNSSDERGFIAADIQQKFGFVHTRPDSYTWSNSRGSQSKIDFIMVSTPAINLTSDTVHTESDYFLDCDHRAVSASYCVMGPSKTKAPRTRRHRNRCGKWRVDGSKAVGLCNKLAEKVELQGRDFNVEDLQALSDSVSFRPKTYRYKDPDHILQLIKQRKLLQGPEARQLGKDILRLRAAAKTTWLTSVLDKASQGDFSAIAYLKKRQNVLTMHNYYVVRAGGVTKATHDLKRYFRLKYTPPDPESNFVPPVDLFLSRVGPFAKPSLITLQEVQSALATCKSGKSCGEDGVSYEFLSVLAHTGLGPHLVDFFNSVLFQTSPIPGQWLVSRLTFLPKISTPSIPSHLRPIVLSSTPGKLFTKILLFRLRAFFPSLSANQLACIPGSQPLEGSTCLQHVIHLSQEYRLPLIAIKLDVSSAFDHLSHDAIASFLALSGGHLESLVLLKIIVLSRVVLGISGHTWQQKLFRGLFTRF